MIAVAGYSLVTLWILIIGSAIADHYGVRAGLVAVWAFLLGVLFLLAVLKTAPEDEWI
jgi:hypothetical protein